VQKNGQKNNKYKFLFISEDYLFNIDKSHFILKRLVNEENIKKYKKYLDKYK